MFSVLAHTASASIVGWQVTAKTCFVIMPFGQLGSERAEHYRMVYDDVLKPTIESLGFEVRRADDNKHTALITKDIISPLAHSDIVVADLSEARPNVLYELGVRHALRKHGTVVLVDKVTTPSLPFDIQQYRAIEYSSQTWKDMGVLRASLAEAIRHETEGNLRDAGNPVHEWIPTLPENVVTSSLGSDLGVLQAQVTQLQSALRKYRERLGPLDDEAEGGSRDARHAIEIALAEAAKGATPVALLGRAESAARKNDVEAFLLVTKEFLDLRASQPSERQLLTLVALADNLNLTSVVVALLDHAQRSFPGNRELRLAQLQNFAHSNDERLRVRARQEMAKDLGISMEGGAVRFSRVLSDLDLGVIGVMLDTYHKDGLHPEALVIMSALMQEHPNRSVVVRNYARALENVGRDHEALKQYRASIFMPDADDTAAIWFGNKLHNIERHVDAAEVYLLACIRDSDDGRGFMHFADEVAIAVSEEAAPIFSTPRVKRVLPAGLSDPKGVAIAAMLAGLSCQGSSESVQERAMRIARRLDVDLENLQQEDLRGRSPPTTRVERVGFVREMIDVFKSELTDPSKESAAPLPGSVH